MLNLRIVPYVIYAVLLAISVYFFYFFYDGVSYSSSAVWGYIILLFVFFSTYKYVQWLYNTKKYQVTPILLLWVFILHLLILCLYFVGISGHNFFLWFILWATLCSRILLIAFLWYIIYLLGRRIVDLSQVFLDNVSEAIVRIVSLVLWFFLLTVALFVLAALWFYNLLWLWIIGVFIFLFIFPYIKNIHSHLQTSIWERELKTDRWYVRTFIDEIHYIIIILFIGVNLISAYRPYPIGWDDLWAYMNYPKLISGFEWLISMGNMYAWELYTGIGYILWSQSFAFLLNSFSWIIASIVLYYTLSLFQKDKDEPVFSYALFWTLILMILPMTVFQLAKDMKLDYGLFFVSLWALALSYYALYSNTKLWGNWKVWYIVWLCIWFAFTIKITSVLLLFAIIWLIAYRYGWIRMYFASFFTIIWLLTLWWLWPMLNVVFPADGNSQILFTYISLFLASVLIFVSYYASKNLESIALCLKHISAVLLWCIIAFLPWGIKNTYETLEAWKSVSVGSLISWQSERLRLDPTLIYTPEEIEDIEKENISGLSEDGITSNEDFWRYFWYESGINNYLKLPWNLTFQVNQWGEFTQITFILFLLLPVFFFVFPYRSPYYIYGLSLTTLLLLAYYIPSPVSSYLTELLWNIRLPFWYIFITLFYFVAFLYTSLSYKKDNKNYSEAFLAILAFTSMYVFFWAISAYGIVWYGIVMYAGFLALIVLWLHQADREKYTYMPYLALFWVWIYIILTGFSHATSNLKNAGYLDFKLWQVSENQAVMKYHHEYFEFLFAFNITPQWQDQVLRDTRRSLIEIFQPYDEFASLNPVIADASTAELLYGLIRSLDRVEMPSSLWREYSQLKENLFSKVINPPEDIRSSANIYRIGTFMTYFMVDNNIRVLQDNLINRFDTYIWNEDLSVVTQRLQDLDMWYMIIDLNAATIDDDPRRDLTRRYENILRYAMSSEVEYITGDSICFRIGRDLYHSWNIPIESALSIASINYGTLEERNARLTDCTVTIYEMIQQWIDQDNEAFVYMEVYRNRLERIVQQLQENDIEITDENVLTHLAGTISRWYKILLDIPDR